MSISRSIVNSLQLRDYSYNSYEPWFHHFAGAGAITTAGENVNPQSAKAVATYFACIRNISEDIASMPRQIREKLGNNRNKYVSGHSLDYALNVSPNDTQEMSAMDFWEALIAHALEFHGGFAEIVFGKQDTVKGLYLLDPTQMQMKRFPQLNSQLQSLFKKEVFGTITPKLNAKTELALQNQLVYVYRNRLENTTVMYLPDDILHLRGLGMDGITAYMVTHIGKEALGLVLATQKYAAAYFGNSSGPEGVIYARGQLTDKNGGKERLRKNWEGIHQGAGKAHHVAVLEEGFKYERTSIDPEKMQLPDMRKLNDVMVCAWFRMPPQKIQELQGLGGRTSEQGALDYYNDCLRPWCTRVESEIKLKLLVGPQDSNLIVYHDWLSRLIVDTQGRADYYQKLLNCGIITANDARAIERMDPAGPEADQLLNMANMLPSRLFLGLDEYPGPQGLKNMPEEPPPGPNGTKKNNSIQRQRVVVAYRPIFEGILRSLTNADHDKIQRAAKNEANFDAWLVKHYVSQGEEVARRFYDTVLAMLVSLGENEAYCDDICAEIAFRYIDDTKKIVEKVKTGEFYPKTRYIQTAQREIAAIGALLLVSEENCSHGN